MDMQAIKDEIQLKLTGDVVSMELSDASLTKIVSSSLREIQRYIDTFAVVTLPFDRCIDLSEYKVSSVIGVRRSEGYMADTANTGYGITDPLYASQWQILSGVGSSNISTMTDYVYNYSAWNSIMQIKNTTSTDLAFYFDKLTSKLYVNISTSTPASITVLYVPRFDDVSQITSDFWIDVLIRMCVAQTKIAVGRVRTKFKQSNALWSLDGDTILQEGLQELSTLREELRSSTQLVYGID